jgi:cytoskeletal protein CcmA (bactofilin family)
MALTISDRIKETTTTTGTGTYTLGGAVTGFETFTVNLSNSDTTYYCCTDNTDFEVGLGTFTSSGTTLARTTILASSNSNNAVSWSSGTRTIFCTLPAAKTVILDASGNASIGGTVTATGSFIIGSADMSEADLEKLDGITNGTVAASKAVVVDSNKDAGTFRNLTASGAITAGSFVIGSADINENDLESIDGITAGTISASKAAIVDSNKDITGFRNVTLTGELDAGSLDVSGDADIDGTLEADAITVNGTALNTVIAGVTVTNATNAAHVSVADNESTNEENLITFIEDASATGNVGLESDGDFSYNPSTGTVSATVFKGNIDAVDGDFDGTLEADAITVGGTALNTVIAGVTVTNATNAAHVSVADNESTNEENLIPFIEDASATGNVGLESDGDFAYNPSTGTVTATIFKGNIDAVDGDFDGTLEADAITVGGTALNTVIAGVTVTNATNSAHVLVTDNESTNEENLITFVEGATSSTGNVGLEMDGNLAYNPSTGTVTATIFKGNIDAVDGDFDGTLEADAITVGGATLSSVIQDEATALAIALG